MKAELNQFSVPIILFIVRGYKDSAIISHKSCTTAPFAVKIEMDVSICIVCTYSW